MLHWNEAAPARHAILRASPKQQGDCSMHSDVFPSCWRVWPPTPGRQGHPRTACFLAAPACASVLRLLPSCQLSECPFTFHPESHCLFSMIPRRLLERWHVTPRFRSASGSDTVRSGRSPPGPCCRRHTPYTPRCAGSLKASLSLEGSRAFLFTRPSCHVHALPASSLESRAGGASRPLGPKSHPQRLQRLVETC